MNSAARDHACPPKLAHLLRLGRALASRVDFSLLVILALPWTLLATGANWVFDYVFRQSYIDPWVYFGYFLDLPAHLKAFQGTYYGSRLSWILLGYACTNYSQR
jgi:hypothetical protein